MDFRSWSHLCILLSLVSCNSIGRISCQEKPSVHGGLSLENITLEADSSDPFVVYVGEKTELHFHCSFPNETLTANDSAFRDLLILVDSKFVSNLGSKLVRVMKENDYNFTVTLEGKIPARTKLVFQVKGDKQTDPYTVKSYSLFVERKERAIDQAFVAVVILLVVLANIGMGCKVDLNVVKTTLKRPIAPAIGLCSQFLLMPLIGFTMAYSLTLEPGVALGFFALGCSPGGSASNVYTNFLKGNLSLSVTMTLISSLAALGFFPLWLFTLGRLIYAENEIKIPFTNILTSLLGIVLPVILGLFLQKKFPKAASFCISAVKYIIIVFFLFVFTVGIYANLYIFYLVTPEVLLASACIPFLGFILGGLFAIITRRVKEDIIAIALETGIQNTGIPIILCKLSLSGPERDTSIVSPVMAAIFTPVPIVIAILYVQLKERFARRLHTPVTDKDEDEQAIDMENSLICTRYPTFSGKE